MEDGIGEELADTLERVSELVDLFARKHGLEIVATRRERDLKIHRNCKVYRQGVAVTFSNGHTYGWAFDPVEFVHG